MKERNSEYILLFITLSKETTNILNRQLVKVNVKQLPNNKNNNS